MPGGPSGDKWIQDKKNHINHLELKDIYITIKHYQSLWKGYQHIRVKFTFTECVNS